MKCQHCHQNEAEHTFILNFQGNTQEMHLCSECMHQVHEYYLSALNSMPGLFEGVSDFPPRFLPTFSHQPQTPFPLDAGGEIRRKRRLNELHSQLEQAIEKEHYEEAARLRDTIAQEEKDVYAL